MIDVEKYKIILDEGLLLDHYFLLLNLKQGKETVKSKRIQGFINLMCKKGYIEDGILTDKAMSLLEGEGNPIPEVIDTKPINRLVDILQTKEPDLKIDKKFDYASWVISLHKKCEDKLVAATGKRQIRDKLDGKSYSFLPNSTDLGRVILRAVSTYKLKDFDKIEKTILRYIDSCIKSNKWFPLLVYYIMKNSMSPMVTDMSNIEDEPTENDDSIVNI